MVIRSTAPQPFAGPGGSSPETDPTGQFGRGSLLTGEFFRGPMTITPPQTFNPVEATPPETFNPVKVISPQTFNPVKATSPQTFNPVTPETSIIARQFDPEPGGGFADVVVPKTGPIIPKIDLAKPLLILVAVIGLFIVLSGFAKGAGRGVTD